MDEISSPEYAIQLVATANEKLKRPSGEFKPLTSGQLLLKTRHKADDLQQRGLLDGTDDDDQDEHEANEDPDRECFLSKVLAVSMTLLVCGFIYFVVIQRCLLKS